MLHMQQEFQIFSNTYHLREMLSSTERERFPIHDYASKNGSVESTDKNEREYDRKTLDLFTQNDCGSLKKWGTRG